MSKQTEIKKAIFRVFENHDQERLHVSFLIGELVDHYFVEGQYYDRYNEVRATITDLIFDKWLDFLPGKGVMIMRHDDIEEEPIPSTQPCPSTLPSMPNQPGVSCQPSIAQGPQNKPTRQDVRVVNANDHTCTSCGNSRCNKTERNCWRCTAPIQS